MPVYGAGERGIMFVAESPGSEEDEQGRPLAGPTGQHLRATLRDLDISLDRDCWATNALICKPGSSKEDTKQLKKRIGFCRPNLLRNINQYKPKVIVLLGGSAVKSLIGWLWREDDGGIGRWWGWQIPSQRLNAWICPTWHPSFLLRSEDVQTQVTQRFFEQHIAAAVAIDSRPWTKIPDYQKQIEVILDANQAAKILREFVKAGGAVAFDYETNMLKPDSEDRQLICCSVCWRGKRTIAYPFYGEAIKATRELLVSPLPKIGANLKFEERWSMAVLGLTVNNWYFDVVNGAHILDNRAGITGVKFQAFVRLGVDGYDDHIKPLLKAKKGVKINRAKQEIELRELLLYCGLDSLLEYKIAIHQMREMGFPLPEA